MFSEKKRLAITRTGRFPCAIREKTTVIVKITMSIGFIIRKSFVFNRDLPLIGPFEIDRIFRLRLLRTQYGHGAACKLGSEHEKRVIP